MSKYAVFEYSAYKFNGQYEIDNQYHTHDVEIDDEITIKELKRQLKKIFNLKPNIRLSSLQIDGDDSIIILYYATRRDYIPIGHLDKYNDDNDDDK